MAGRWGSWLVETGESGVADYATRDCGIGTYKPSQCRVVRLDGAFSTCHMPLGVLQLREFSKGVPTRELVFGCEIRPFSVNSLIEEPVPEKFAFSRENSRYSHYNSAL